MRPNMSRRGFLGAAGAGVAALGMGRRARAIGGDEPWENKLYPTGVAETDYGNLKNYLGRMGRRGGVLRLMGMDTSGKPMYFNLVNERTPFEPIEIMKDTTIIGQGAKIVHNSTVFVCRSAVKLSIRGLHFSMLDGQTPSPFDFIKPSNDGDIHLSVQVSIGNDDPWDMPP